MVDHLTAYLRHRKSKNAGGVDSCGVTAEMSPGGAAPSYVHDAYEIGFSAEQEAAEQKLRNGEITAEQYLDELDRLRKLHEMEQSAPRGNPNYTLHSMTASDEWTGTGMSDRGNLGEDKGVDKTAPLSATTMQQHESVNQDNIERLKRRKLERQRREYGTTPAGWDSTSSRSSAMSLIHKVTGKMPLSAKAAGLVCEVCGGNHFEGVLWTEATIGAYAKKLMAEARDRLDDSSFVFSEDRSYPIHDRAHASNALSRVSQHGTPEEKAAVIATVKRRYPDLGQE